MEIETLLAIFSGGLAGAYFSCRFNSGRNRTDLSLKIIEEIGGKIEKVEAVYSILKNDVSSDGDLWEKDEDLRKQKFDKIISIGDYLDTITFLYLSYRVNRRLFEKSHICLILDEFISLLKKFKTSKYNIENNQYENQEWQKAWQYIDDYKRKKTYKWDLFRLIVFG